MDVKKQNNKIINTKKSMNILSLTENIIEFNNVNFRYKQNTNNILDNVSFSVKKGEFFTILGPSGSGKSTIIRLIGGFEKLRNDNGQILYYGKNINVISPQKRDFKTIFQNLGLFPHLNVYENIAYSLSVKREKPKFIRKKVSEMLSLVKLEGFEKRKINELSGGQMQRVAIARSLITNPDILLLDEPFSAIDIKLKKDLERVLVHIQWKTKITFILVTHDQEQSLFLSDSLIVINEGKIIQKGEPQNIYNEPINKWVGSFIGYSNILENAIWKGNKQYKYGNKVLKCIDEGFKVGEKVDVLIRPEDINVVKKGKGNFNGIVTDTLFKGIHWDVTVKTNYYTFNIHTTKHIKEDIEVGIFWDINDVHVMKQINRNK